MHSPLRPSLAALSAVLLLASTGAAKAQTVQEGDVACKDAAGMDQPDIACAEQAFIKAQVEVYRVHQRLRRKLAARRPESPDADRDVPGELDRALKLWVQLRNADCGLLLGVSGDGNAASLNWFQCLLDRTQKRIAELQALERMVEQ